MKDALQHDKRKWLSMGVFLFAALGGVLYGYDLGIINDALLVIPSTILSSPAEKSTIAAAVLGGGAFATLITGRLADWLGRRLMIALSCVVFLIGVYLLVHATTYAQLLWGRVVQGVGVGIITIAVPLYLTEAMPLKWRGRGVTAFQLLLTAGILLASLVGQFYTVTADWQTMFLTSAIPAVIMLVGCCFLSNSPRWLVMKGKIDKAMKVLQKTRTLEVAQSELEAIKQSFSNRDNWRDLFQRGYLVPLLIAFGVGICNQLTGINTILQLSSEIFKQSGISSNGQAALGTTLITGLNFAVTILVIPFIDRFERKTFMALGTGGIILAWVFCSIVYWTMPAGQVRAYCLMGGILFFILSYAFGPGSLVWIVLSEVLPSRVRSMGLAVSLFLNSLTSSILAKVFLPIANWGGFPAVFLLCAASTVVYFIIAVKWLPKTKNQSLEDIEQSFMK